MIRKTKSPAAKGPPAHTKKKKNKRDIIADALNAVYEEKQKDREDLSANASMTIYLALTMIIVLVLICTVTESARVSTLWSQARSLSYIGMDSVFGQFAEPVFEDYGIMLVWKSQEEFEEEFEEYVNSNLDTSDIAFTANADFYGLSLESAEVEELAVITDDNGLIFADQVYEYMNYCMAQSAAEELLSGLDIFAQSDTVSDFMDTINEYSDVFTEVEEKVSDVKDCIEKVRRMTEDPASILDSLFEIASSADGTADSSEFLSLFEELKDVKESLEDALSDIQSETEEYYESVDEAKGAASELEQTLSSKAADLDDEIYEIIEEQLDELKEKSADTDADYYGVGANSGTVQEYIDKLESLESLFTDLSEDLSEENAAEYAQILSGYQDLFADFDLSSLDINFEAIEVESEDDSFLDTISDLLSGGVIAYVKDDVSEKTVETEELPSVTVDTSVSDSQEDLLTATANKVIFGEYVLMHFGNAVNTLDDTALDYEAEYILAGKDSDLKNLKAVVARIVALRSGLNFISILKDTAKKQEAYTLATALVGFTGLPVLITVVQMLILTAWASAEAVTDVKALLDGEKVPTIKDASEWNLSIEGLKNFTGDDIETVSYESGLEYEDYLRVLLAMQGRQKQYFRTMDVIQLNMCLNENEDFRMTQGIVSARVNASFCADELFTSFSWVSSEIELSGGGYSFSVVQSYEY